MGDSRTQPKLAGLVLGLGLTVVLAPGASPVLEACSCAWSPVNHPCESYDERSVVFLGRAIEERRVDLGQRGWYRRIYTFTVEEPFHGVTGPTVEITTGMGGGDCGVDFEIGLPAFVHAWKTDSSDYLEVGLCGSRSTRDLGSPHVDYGRSVAAGEPGVAIFGRVTARSPDASPPVQGVGLDGVAVSVQGPDGHSLWTTTDSEGRFEIPGPLHGRYTVRAELPEEDGPVPDQTVEVVGERCQGVELVVNTSTP